MDNACVVGGLGTCGNATRTALGIDYYIDLKDSNITYEAASDKRYIFICTPTPVKDGRYQTDDILEIIKHFLQFGKQNVFVVRSTVFPGFCRHVCDTLGISNVVHNPEFLTESTWMQDARHPDLIVVGGEQSNYIDDVVGLYSGRFKGVDIFKTNTVTSELLKLAVNGFYTTKVIYANQIYDFAKKVGADYTLIRDAMYQRKWIGKNHLDVFHGGYRGAGGKCLNKDMEALAEYSGSELLRLVNQINQTYLKSAGKL